MLLFVAHCLLLFVVIVKRTMEAGWSSSDSDADSEEVTQLHSFDLVWAKCKGYPWYPGLVS